MTRIKLLNLKIFLRAEDKTIEKHNLVCTRLGVQFPTHERIWRERQCCSFRKRENKPQKLKVARERRSPRSRLSFQKLQGPIYKEMKIGSRLLISLHQHHPVIPQTRYHFPIPNACPFPKHMAGFPPIMEKLLTNPLLQRLSSFS